MRMVRLAYLRHRNESEYENDHELDKSWTLEYNQPEEVIQIPPITVRSFDEILATLDIRLDMYLEEAFGICHRPDSLDLRLISAATEMTEEEVAKWFKKRRSIQRLFKKIRHRPFAVFLSKRQVSILEEQYSEDQWPDRIKRQGIARKLRTEADKSTYFISTLTEKQVSQWFHLRGRLGEAWRSSVQSNHKYEKRGIIKVVL